MREAAPPELRIDRSATKALRLFSEDTLRWVDEAAALGPLAGLRFGPMTIWVLTDADAAREVLISGAGLGRGRLR